MAEEVNNLACHECRAVVGHELGCSLFDDEEVLTEEPGPGRIEDPVCRGLPQIAKAMKLDAKAVRAKAEKAEAERLDKAKAAEPAQTSAKSVAAKLKAAKKAKK